MARPARASLHLKCTAPARGFGPTILARAPRAGRCALALASTFDRSSVAAFATAAAAEFSRQGRAPPSAPSANVHRVARGGRNAEYLSGEDPRAGCGARIIGGRGFQSKGIMTVAKHFGFNQQESAGTRMMHWSAEAKALLLRPL